MRYVGLLLLAFLLSPSTPAQQAASISSLSRSRTQPLQPERTDLTQDGPAPDTYLVNGVAEKLLALQDVNVRAMGVARLANVVWTQNEPYARMLFERSLDIASAPAKDGDVRQLSPLRRNVIAIIARRDSEWAKRLIDSAFQKEPSDQDLKARSVTNLSTALNLLEEDPNVAVEFAERSLQGGVNPALLDFLLDLRKTREASANQLFLNVLSCLGQQGFVDIKQLHTLGIYLFTAPDLLDSDHYAITRVGDIMVPNIIAQRPGVPAPLVRAYLQIAGSVLWRTVSDLEQRKYSYALAYLLLPKARSVAPYLAPQIEATMAALAADVPANLRDETAYKHINAAPASAEDSLSNAEAKPDQDSRDAAYLDLAFNAWIKGDFKTARLAGGRIANLETSQRLSVLIDFGEAASLIKRDAKQIAQVQRIADKLPPGIERAILFLALAQARAGAGQAIQAEEATDDALRAARSVADVRRPFLLLIGAGQLASLHSPNLGFVLTDAVKDFNSFDSSSYAAIEWSQRVQAGALTESFPLRISAVPFNFAPAFRAVANADVELGMSRVEELKNENLRALAFVEVAAALLERIAKDPAQGVQAIRVGEDGMRKSASRIVMPGYPEEALHKAQQGVAVVEVQYDGKGDVTQVAILEAPANSISEALVKALKQWKFVPSKTKDGKLVSIRGKLTFYFRIDKDGKGRVENPKQFR